MKYLGLIRSVCLLRQYQRTVKTVSDQGEPVEYIEVALDDIEAANRLANEVLGRTLDELSPQTRNFLMLIDRMVTEACERLSMERPDYRFSRRDVRLYTGWTDNQLKVHMRKLEELEYLLIHRGGRGLSMVYELLYQGEGQDGSSFLMGLLDVNKLGCVYDEKKLHQNQDLAGLESEKSAPSRGDVGLKSPPSRMPNLASIHVPQNGNGHRKHVVGEKDFWPSYAQINHRYIPLAAKAEGGAG